MARFYADDDFPRQVADALRELGQDVLTANESGRANQRIPDQAVLDFAAHLERALLSVNRNDFIHRYATYSGHAGIIVCTQDADTEGQALRIHEAVLPFATLKARLIRLNRPRSST